jgi:hypothetical protein
MPAGIRTTCSVVSNKTKSNSDISQARDIPRWFKQDLKQEALSEREL